MFEIKNVSLPDMHLIVTFEFQDGIYYQTGAEFCLFIIDEFPVYDIINSLN